MEHRPPAGVVLQVGVRSVVTGAAAEPAPCGAAKVVVAEDDVLVRLVLADTLRTEGFHVFEAAHEHEAISILQATPGVGAVIFDMQMRNAQSGMGLAKYVRAHCPGILLALASAYNPPPAERANFDAYFMKPYSPEKIAAWLKRGFGITGRQADCDELTARQRRS